MGSCYRSGMPRTDKPVQPGPSFNAVKLPGSARTDHEVSPATTQTAVARVVRVEAATEAEVVEMLAEQTRFAADPELRAVAVQLLVAGYTVRDTCKRLRIRPSIMWGWAEDAQVKAAIEKGKELRKRSLGQSLEDAAEAALETLIDVMGDEATTPKDRLKAAELILDRCGLVEIAKGTPQAQETAVRIDVDFDERLARIVAGTRTA